MQLSDHQNTIDPYGETRLVAESDRQTRLKIRCAKCGKLLAEMVTAPWTLRCPRCKSVNQSAPQPTDSPSNASETAQNGV